MDVGGLLSQLMLVDVAGFSLLLPSEEIKSCRLVSKEVGQVYYEGVVGVDSTLWNNLKLCSNLETNPSHPFLPWSDHFSLCGLQNGYWNGLVNMYTLTNGIDKFASDAALVKSINMGGDSINLLFCYKKAFSVTELQMLNCSSALFC